MKKNENIKNNPVKETKTEEKNSKKSVVNSTVFLFVSWILFFVINIPSDFENNFLIFLGFALIIVSTIIFIRTLLKLPKNPENLPATTNNKAATVNTNSNPQNNEFMGQTKEKILQSIYEKYEDYMDKYDHYFLYFSGWWSSYSQTTDSERKAYYCQTSKEEFITSLFIKILLSANEVEKKKAIKFIKNLDADIFEELEATYELDDEKMKKEIEDQNSSSINDSFAGIDFDKWQKMTFNKLSSMKDYDWELTQELWNNFILDIQNAYNAYVSPEKPLNLLGQYGKTSAENESDSSAKAFYMFYLPIILIIIMVIKFFIELFGEGGIVMSGGWWSVIILIILIIWACIGNSGKYNTCSNCKKWNSLKLDSDTIIDSRDTWKTKTVSNNGRTYQKQVAVRVERHKECYTCEHCGNKEVKYRDREHEL